MPPPRALHSAHTLPPLYPRATADAVMAHLHALGYDSLPTDLLESIALDLNDATVPDSDAFDRTNTSLADHLHELSSFVAAAGDSVFEGESGWDLDASSHLDVPSTSRLGATSAHLDGDESTDLDLDLSRLTVASPDPARRRPRRRIHAPAATRSIARDPTPPAPLAHSGSESGPRSIVEKPSVSWDVSVSGDRSGAAAGQTSTSAVELSLPSEQPEWSSGHHDDDGVPPATDISDMAVSRAELEAYLAELGYDPRELASEIMEEMLEGLQDLALLEELGEEDDEFSADQDYEPEDDDDLDRTPTPGRAGSAASRQSRRQQHDPDETEEWATTTRSDSRASSHSSYGSVSPRSARPRSGFIRTTISTPCPARASSRDPVKRYHQYAARWASTPFLARHANPHRQKPIPTVASLTPDPRLERRPHHDLARMRPAYVVPSEKKREKLCWSVRERMALRSS
ncbi:hypothetical protein AMAG_06944 [Allomyces macrogynus ATCC 38327]|uniref:Centriolar and ciliogenesis-associated protein HYLS1 C-terminal domain-containing protein n=1 Tax=Allomyces macrogynus (strain ATCC 38327) TaxID=578462 RepID=A0A0L0SFI0_ALLM3|nr:hypothetical protein AMAG_06944 [Allomyces macrogynus ATCC 38327]|eukprot:KNE61194.1 hypothetical protein AMAG_06944 [Allomyces macrogynus ATCC 38327]